MTSTSPTRRPNRIQRRLERQRTRVTTPAEPLTADQYEAARLGHPGLTADEAAFYVHESERYLYDRELWSRDAMPEDWEAQRQYERARNAEERREPGGRIRRAMAQRERERLSLPNKRWAREYYAQFADCPF
jgi:hypothetical protein